MAHLYQRPRSPFWWIKYRDPKTNQVVRESTGYKIGLGNDTRAAQRMEAERTLAEKQVGSVAHADGWDWVIPFLDGRYATSPLTLARNKNSWQTLRMYLKEKEIQSPRNLHREHCLAFYNWRKDAKPDAGKRKVAHNTILIDVKTLGVIMKEAVQRGYASFNPARELGITKERGKIKPELTDTDLALICAEIEKQPEPLRTFFRNSYALGRYQGCRLRETYLNPQTDVVIGEVGGKKRGQITFRIKGDRMHTAPMHPELFPLFEKLIAEGKTETYPLPGRAPELLAAGERKSITEVLSRKWADFFRDIGLKARLPNVCFHSLRVTAISILARSGVKESKAMKYIGHSNYLVHQLYQRFRPDDLDDCAEALG